MFHEIFQRIIPRLRRFQSQIRLGHRAQRRDQHGAARAFRSSQNRLKKLEGPLAMVQLGLEPALEEAFLFLVRERDRVLPCRGCDAPPPYLVSRATIRPSEVRRGPSHCGSEKRTCENSAAPRRDVAAPSRPPLVRGSPWNEMAKLLGRDLLVKRERLRPAFQSGESLRAAKPRGRQSQQSRILQHLQSFLRLTRREKRFPQFRAGALFDLPREIATEQCA